MECFDHQLSYCGFRFWTSSWPYSEFIQFWQSAANDDDNEMNNLQIAVEGCRKESIC